MRALFFVLKIVCLIGLGGAFGSMYFMAIAAPGYTSWSSWQGYGEEVLAAVWLCAYALLCMAENSGWGR